MSEDVERPTLEKKKTRTTHKTLLIAQRLARCLHNEHKQTARDALVIWQCAVPMTQLCLTMMTLADDNDATHAMAQCSCFHGRELLECESTMSRSDARSCFLM